MSVTPATLAALCASTMPNERLGADELEYLCDGEGDEAFGDERGAAVLHSQRFGASLAA